MSDVFVPEQLIAARERMELTRAALANNLGFSSRTLTRFEKGETSPSHAQIQELAQALHVHTNYFFDDAAEKINQETISFRRASRTSAKKLKAAQQHGVIIEKFFHAIEDKFELPSLDIPNLHSFQPEAAAGQIRETCNIGEKPIDNIVEIAESLGVRIAALPNATKEVDAFCFIRDSRAYIVINVSKSAERVRFDVAHELGHLALHQDESFKTQDSKDKEQQADQFAAEFLMPARRVRMQNLRNASFTQVIEAKNYWGVSAMAMVYRLKTLELISDWQHRDLIIRLAKAGYRNSEPNGRLYDSSSLLRQTIHSSTRLLRINNVSENLSLPTSEIYPYLNKLVPVPVIEGV